MKALKYLSIISTLSFIIVVYSCGDSDSTTKDTFLNSTCDATWDRYYSMFSTPIDWTVLISALREDDSYEQTRQASQEGGDIQVVKSESSDTDTVSKSSFISECNLIKQAYTEQNDVVQETTYKGKSSLHIATTISHNLAVQLLSRRDNATTFTNTLLSNPNSTVHFIGDVTPDGFVLRENIYFEDSSSVKYSNNFEVNTLNF